MSGIRGRDTQPELAVRRILHACGLRYRLHVRRLPGRPDIVLPRYRAVVFVHGCFWHQHAGCPYAYRPKSNREFWESKLDGNVARDELQQRILGELGWRVFVVWECGATPDRLDGLVDEIRRGTAS
jgi:DNA mismatch endonuclease (patch repair protein)